MLSSVHSSISLSPLLRMVQTALRVAFGLLAPALEIFLMALRDFLATRLTLATTELCARSLAKRWGLVMWSSWFCYFPMYSALIPLLPMYSCLLYTSDAADE
eukprot:TRINITY_DN764_c0_g2_i9.p1 TRINITY_DN764_c0_g2~~TRINITY_DN764_c0_g2_i9.p1  ORF type:complete len:102 (+),score=3.75 TRINITY_DN764_c0_g2_i9:278-583(+)